MPGRKTDVKDCEWLAELLEHGLLRASFIPPRPIRELRELTRHRKCLIEQRAHEVNRVQKLLETANIKLGLVATDVLGSSGRAMLRALQAGERDGARLAELARGTLRRKRPGLACPPAPQTSPRRLDPSRPVARRSRKGEAKLVVPLVNSSVLYPVSRRWRR